MPRFVQVNLITVAFTLALAIPTPYAGLDVSFPTSNLAVHVGVSVHVCVRVRYGIPRSSISRQFL